MSMDHFAAMANRQHAEKEKQRREAAQQIDMENNAFTEELERRKKWAEQQKVLQKEAAAAKRAKAEKIDEENRAEMVKCLSALGTFLACVGRPVTGFYVNPGGETITVHRETESIRVQGCNITDTQARWKTLSMIVSAVIGGR